MLDLSQDTGTSLHSDGWEMAASTNGKNSCPVATYFPCLAELIEQESLRIEFMSKMAAVFKINCCLFPQLSHIWREYLPNIPGTDVQYIRCLQLLGRTWYEGDTGQYPASFVFKRSLVNARTRSWSISSKQCLFPRAVLLINMNIGELGGE